ncbi:MAG: response regulator [Actinomycetota bacterium]
MPSGDSLPEDEIELEKTRLLFQNAGLAQTITAINGGVLLFILGGLSPPPWAVGWLLLALTVSGFRYGLARSFARRAPPPAEAGRWRRRAIAGALVAGLAWGSGVTAIMVAEPDTARLFAALVMCGMVAGAVPILSSVPAAFRAYTAPVMLAIVATAVMDNHGARDWMLALIAVLFLFALVKSARYFHDSLDNSIRLALGMRRMAEQLDLARRGAEAASTAKSRFLAAMSHEIRTPMNGILGMAQILQEPRMEDAERREYANTILSSGQSLLRLLNDILDLSKVEAGKLELRPSAFDPGRLIAEIASLFAEPAHEKGLALNTAWNGPEACRYRADASLLRQMLTNFASNSIKFTFHGSIRIEAREVARVGDSALLEFAVADTGIGIPEDKRSLLFQPFSQVDGSDTRQFGGTGLGLSIVSNLARLMEGEVGVESKEGKGSRFWFRVRAEVMPAAELSPPSAQADFPAGLAGRHVLLVEDNGINRMVIRTMLEKHGVRTSSADNGQEALDALAGGFVPDLILMDCQMPVMDGFEATARIRQRELALGLTRTPIVALTAGAFEEDRHRCLGAGMDDFLAKPINLSELLAALAKWLVVKRENPASS